MSIDNIGAAQAPPASERRFYVYTYTRDDSGEVVYVGKGTGDRSRVHLTNAERVNRGLEPYCKRTRWLMWLAKRLREGVAFTVARVVDGVSGEQACELELRRLAGEGLSKTEQARRMALWTYRGHRAPIGVLTRLWREVLGVKNPNGCMALVTTTRRDYDEQQREAA